MSGTRGRKEKIAFILVAGSVIAGIVMSAAMVPNWITLAALALPVGIGLYVMAKEDLKKIDNKENWNNP